MAEYEKLFNENMSSSEARYAYFAAVKGKTETEVSKITEAYSKVRHLILKKKMELVAAGWIVD